MITHPNPSQTNGVTMHFGLALQTIRSTVLTVVLLAFAVLCPTKAAQAESVFEVLDKVCSGLPSLCGAADDYTKVAKACFKEKDELGCVVAIIGVAGGGSSNQLDGIFACVKAVPRSLRLM